jgi:hypothetical protein
MKILFFPVVFGLALAACAPADEGSRAAAVEISLSSPIDHPDAAGREAFWNVRMGDGDVADAYTLDPPPPQGAVLALLAVPEDRANTLTLELVRADDTVAARFDTTQDTVRFIWTVQEEVFLRLLADGDAPAFDALIGVRSIEGRPIGWRPRPVDTSAEEPEETLGEVPPLVVPLPLRD